MGLHNGKRKGADKIKMLNANVKGVCQTHFLTN